MIENPTFLVGAERSGTTLLRLMLDHHPQVAFLHEFEFAVDCVGDDGTCPALPDYYRYLAEFTTGAVQADVASKAEKAYELASNVAVHKLAPTHPIGLGLALNYSVFLFEVQGKSSEACTLAKQAFDDATAELDTLDEEAYR